MKTNIAVLLSTYNGEKYLGELLDSILAQKLEVDQRMTIFVRDDGSTDRTKEILREYAGEYDSIRLIGADKTENIGVKRSFFALLSAALSDRESHFFAFADQDDVWLPDKMHEAVNMLEDCDTGNAAGRLYFSNKTITDQNLNILWKENDGFKRSPVFSVSKSNAYGCTMVMDRAFASIAERHIPNICAYHDNWLYRLASSIGTEIVFDSNSYILYRQHQKNVAGAKKQTTVAEKIQYVTGDKDHYVQKIFKEIYAEYGDEVEAGPYAKEVRALARYTDSLRDRLVLLCNKDIMSTGAREYFRWAVRVMGNLI